MKAEKTNRTYFFLLLVSFPSFFFLIPGPIMASVAGVRARPRPHGPATPAAIVATNAGRAARTGQRFGARAARHGRLAARAAD